MPPASPDPRAARETRSTRDTWDVIVIGGGPAGENAADYAIRGSDRTAVIVENELLGGECSYWACMPSKALLRSVELFTEAESLQGTATRLSTKGIDVKAVLGRRDDFTSHLDDAGQVKWAKGAGIDVLRGHGRLTGTRTVQVADSEGPARDITARHAVIVATGTTATHPRHPRPASGAALDLAGRHQPAPDPAPGRDPRRRASWPARPRPGSSASGCEELTLIDVGDRILARVRAVRQRAGPAVPGRQRRQGPHRDQGHRGVAESRPRTTGSATSAAVP